MGFEGGESELSGSGMLVRARAVVTKWKLNGEEGHVFGAMIRFGGLSSERNVTSEFQKR